MDWFSYKDIDFRNLHKLSGHARKLDFLWMTAQPFEIKNISMWTGFNAKYHVDHLQKQTVFYMPNIYVPPTSTDLVAEALKLTEKCAKECD